MTSHPAVQREHQLPQPGLDHPSGVLNNLAVLHVGKLQIPVGEIQTAKPCCFQDKYIINPDCPCALPNIWSGPFCPPSQIQANTVLRLSCSLSGDQPLLGIFFIRCCPASIHEKIERKMSDVVIILLLL